MKVKILAGLLGILVFGGSANAAPVTLNFTASVLQSNLSSLLGIGDNVSGSVSYDTDWSQGSGSVDQANYSGFAPTPSSFTILSTQLTAGDGQRGFISVNDWTTQLLLDGYGFHGEYAGGAGVGGFVLMGYDIMMFTWKPDVVTSLALPTALPDLDLFEIDRSLSLRFDAGNVVAHIDSISVSVAQVPEPTSLALAGIGLLGVLATRRRPV